MTVITNEIVKRFEQYLYEQERSENTIEKYMRDIRFFREWLGGKVLDKSAMLKYKKELCEKYMPASVNSVFLHFFWNIMKNFTDDINFI